jgi:YegS/Rv2252/BmrU family lipid kinase
VLITNPAAARTSVQAVRTACRELAAAGWSVEVQATGGPGDAFRIAGDAVRAGVDIVAVQGGDGTAMQAAAALVGTDVALGLVPGGTGNLLAGNLRIPRSAARAARVLAAGHRRRIDLGRVDRPRGVVYFSVACGAGVDAQVMHQTPGRAKQRWGMGAYVATALRVLPTLQSYRSLITVDGVQYEAEAAMILVANCGEVVPPLLRLAPDIRPDDAILDVVVVRADGLWGSVRALWHYLRHLPGPRADGPWIGYARGRRIMVETDVPQPVQLDGEPEGETPFVAEVVPGAIWVVVPKER